MLLLCSTVQSLNELSSFHSDYRALHEHEPSFCEPSTLQDQDRFACDMHTLEPRPDDRSSQQSASAVVHLPKCTSKQKAPDFPMALLPMLAHDAARRTRRTKFGYVTTSTVQDDVQRGMSFYFTESDDRSTTTTRPVVGSYKARLP